MSPPISKEWWLAAALTSASVPAALGQPATTGPQRQVGVVTSVKSGAVTYVPLIGDGTRDLPVTNNTDAPMHVMFTDQSAVTIGPKSAMVIKLYEHDAQKKTGNVVIEMAQGLMRYVGGQISKRNGATIRTGTATIGIRGGITVVERENNQTKAHYLFGQSMRVTDNSGNTQTVTRPGFGVTSSSVGVGSPTRTNLNEFSQLTNRLGGDPPGRTATGATQPGGAPPGQLLGTGINVAGGSTGPGSTLGNNQIRTVTNPNSGANPTQTLRNILGSGQAPNQS